MAAVATATAIPPSQRRAPRPPARRRDLVVRPLDDAGGHVVKDPLTGEYFNLGPQESFLLLQLDGVRTAAQIRSAFQARFGEPLDEPDFQEFIELARTQGFLAQPAVAPAPVARKSPAATPAA